MADMRRDDPKKKPASGDFSGYYDLKQDAVDKLVNAGKNGAPRFSEDELNKYRSKKGFHIPAWAKITLLKAWFYGAVCFFFLWGLGTYVTAKWDMMLILCIAMGLVTDLLVNHIIRFMEKTPGENSRWMMFPKKHWSSLMLNIFYSLLILSCVYTFYNAINAWLAATSGSSEQVTLGVEPILFGLLCMGFDLVFVKLKNGFLTVFHDAREAQSGRKDRKDEPSCR